MPLKRHAGAMALGETAYQVVVVYTVTASDETEAAATISAMRSWTPRQVIGADVERVNAA